MVLESLIDNLPIIVDYPIYAPVPFIVPDPLTAGILLLKFDDAAKEVEAQKRRLAAVPGEQGGVALLAGNPLANHLL